MHYDFFDRVPRSWTWFGCKQLKAVLAAALHCLDVGVSLSDLAAEDSPLVWLSQGFTKINGYSREDVVGHNCRFLQNECSDPDAVLQMRRAVERGEHTRVHVWNAGLDNEGFWSLVSLQPGIDEVVGAGAGAGGGPGTSPLGSKMASRGASRRVSKDSDGSDEVQPSPTPSSSAASAAPSAATAAAGGERTTRAARSLGGRAASRRSGTRAHGT